MVIQNGSFMEESTSCVPGCNSSVVGSVGKS